MDCSLHWSLYCTVSALPAPDPLSALPSASSRSPAWLRCLQAASTLQLWSAGMLQGASGSGLQPLLQRCCSRSSGLHLQPAPANLCTSRAWPPAHCISTQSCWSCKHPAESLLGWNSPSLPAASSAGRALQGSCLQAGCTVLPEFSSLHLVRIEPHCSFNIFKLLHHFASCIGCRGCKGCRHGTQCCTQHHAASDRKAAKVCTGCYAAKRLQAPDKHISAHTPLQALQTTFLAVCTEAHQCKVSTRTLAPLLLLLHLELLQELQPASLAAATPPNYTALQLHSKLPPSSTSATAQLPANRAAWPQPRLHLCTNSTSHLQRSCICCLVRPLHAVSLQWLQRLHLCNCTSGWKRHRLHLHCRHPNEGFLHAFSLFQWFFNFSMAFE